jgi:hypothetical protein
MLDCAYGGSIKPIYSAQIVDKLINNGFAGFDPRLIRSRHRRCPVRDVITLSFPEEYTLDGQSIKFVQGVVGIYFIYLARIRIDYPFRPSRLIYIGMSESKQHSIGNRLREHLTGQSGNLGIANYASKHDVRFTYQSLDMLRILGTDLYEFEYLFLADFLKQYGCYPICNGQSGVSVASPSINPTGVKVLWKSFDG